jgi:hypothetical protein
MAATVTFLQATGVPAPLKPKPPGDVYCCSVVIVPAASDVYPAGGIPFTVASVPGGNYELIERIAVEMLTPITNVVDVSYDYTNGKIIGYASAGTVTPTNTSLNNLSVQLGLWLR